MQKSNNFLFKQFSEKSGEDSAYKDDVARLLSSLSPEQTAKLNALLSDQTKIEQILSSKKAASLLKALTQDGKKNG